MTTMSSRNDLSWLMDSRFDGRLTRAALISLMIAHTHQYAFLCQAFSLFCNGAYVEGRECDILSLMFRCNIELVTAHCNWWAQSPRILRHGSRWPHCVDLVLCRSVEVVGSNAALVTLNRSKLYNIIFVIVRISGNLDVMDCRRYNRCRVCHCRALD